MTPRAARILAWSVFGAFGAIAVLTVVVSLMGPGGDDSVLVALVAGFPLVGALVAARQPRNAVGWLLLTVGLALALTALADANVMSADAPAIELSAWISAWGWYVWLTCAGIFLPLVFPDGRLPSRRWRPALWLGVIALVLSVVSMALAPGPIDTDAARPVENPVGIAGAGGLFDVLSNIGDVLAAAAFVLAAASLVVRFRRSQGRERQQLKWFAMVGLTVAFGLATAMAQVLFGANPEDPNATGGTLEVVGAVGWFTALGAIMIGIPLATGLAILRHRLYDVDVVIRRTAVYGALTLTLLASYLGLVLVLQEVLSPDSDFAIAGSTLAVAALVRPARTRIQELVDRRFYRSRYDAEHTIETFGARLREEVELDSLSRGLSAVVRDTMQPAHVSLWLREAPR